MMTVEKPTRYIFPFLATSALVAALSFSLVAYARLTETGNAAAGFRATGPGGLHIDGKASDVTVADDGTAVTLTVSLENIDTGVGLRDKHTKEDLEADKFPNAELEVKRSKLKFLAAGAGASGTAKGKLTIHGISKDVKFSYAATRDGDVYNVEGSASINVLDFGVEPRSYLGISIKPDVEIYAKFQAKDN